MDWQAMAKEAGNLFAKEGYSCSEALVLAFDRCAGLNSQDIPRIATGFGAGIGRKGSLCGALTGGIMILGLRTGRMEAEDVSAKEKTLEAAGKYYDMFQSEFGSVFCKSVCGCDLSTPAGRKEFKERDVRIRTCQNVILKACGLLAKIDQEHQ